MTVRVVIADDQDLIRAGLAMIIDARPDLTVVGEAADGVEAVAVVNRTRPDVVLMDVRMPRQDGIEATRALVAAGDAARVVMLTAFDLDEPVYAALRAGASAFRLKDTRPADLAEAVRVVRVVAGGAALLAPTVTRPLLNRFARVRRGPRPPRAAGLLTRPPGDATS